MYEKRERNSQTHNSLFSTLLDALHLQSYLQPGGPGEFHQIVCGGDTSLALIARFLCPRSQALKLESFNMNFIQNQRSV